LLLWPVRLYQQHPDPGHARGSLLAGTVRGLAEMARVPPPAGMAVLRQRRRHPHRRRPPRIPHRQGRLPQRTRIGCLERLSPLRTGRSVHAVSSDTRRRETRIFGSNSSSHLQCARLSRYATTGALAELVVAYLDRGR
jgi:hypothetical protein